MGVSFLLKPLNRKQARSAERTIEVLWCCRGARCRKSTGFSIPVSSWNARRRRMKEGHVNSKGETAENVNLILGNLERMTGEWLDRIPKGTVPNDAMLAAELSRMLGSANGNKRSLFDDYADFIDYGINIRKWSRGTAVVHRNQMRRLKDFKPDARWSMVDAPFIERYTLWLSQEEGLQDCTVRKAVQQLKEFISWAAERGLYDISRMGRASYKWKDTKNPVVHLTGEELIGFYRYRVPADGTVLSLEGMDGRRYRYTVSGSSPMGKARDLWCFMAFTGLRVSDLPGIRRKDIRNGVLSLTTRKTDDALHIVLNSYAVAILEKYRKETEKYDCPLPVMSSQKINDYVKQLARIFGLNRPVTFIRYVDGKRRDEVSEMWEKVTCHTGRRTFICNALAAGCSAEQVMSFTGHSDYKSMRPYINIDTETKREMVRKMEELYEEC